MQVFLSFGVYYDGVQDAGRKQEQDEEEKKKKEEASQELNNTLGFIEVCNKHTQARVHTECGVTLTHIFSRKRKTLKKPWCKMMRAIR